jgi:hypothetical protein
MDQRMTEWVRQLVVAGNEDGPVFVYRLNNANTWYRNIKTFTFVFIPTEDQRKQARKLAEDKAEIFFAKLEGKARADFEIAISKYMEACG